MISGITDRIRKITRKKIKAKGLFRNYWYPKFEFQMSPRQLCYLADCFDKIKNVDGAIVEIGCAHGLTTSFLYEYMIDSNFKKEYVCIDTFSGFTEQDIMSEVNSRDKEKSTYTDLFKDNDPKWFLEALLKRQITDVEVISADISGLPEESLPREIAFCLIDVDLYQPVKAALKKVFPRLSTEGMIVVDDCWHRPNRFVPGVPENFDGAMEAYREFLVDYKLPENLVESKFGVITKS